MVSVHKPFSLPKLAGMVGSALVLSLLPDVNPVLKGA